MRLFKQMNLNIFYTFFCFFLILFFYPYALPHCAASPTTSLFSGSLITSPPLPCILHNGCECNHSKPFINPEDGQTYGTCISCDDGFTGPTCERRRVDCVNFGTKLPNGSCACLAPFIGEDCRDRECLHVRGSDKLVVEKGVWGVSGRPNENDNYGGASPSFARPFLHNFSLKKTLPNPAGYCPSCLEGYSGISCELCSRDSACGRGETCQRALEPLSKLQQLDCVVTDEPFLRPLGPGRNVSGKVEFRARSPSAFRNDGDANFTVALYREEAGESFLEPFFFCSGFKCSAKRIIASRTVERRQLFLKQWSIKSIINNNINNNNNNVLMANNKDTVTLRERVFEIVKITGQVVLLALCFIVSIVRYVPGPRRRQRAAVKISVITLISCLCVYILLAVGFMSSRPHAQVREVLYSCEQTTCVCGDKTRFSPDCQSSSFGKYILPTITHRTEVRCDAETGQCVFTPMDVSTSIKLKCKASQCVSKDATVPHKDPSGGGGDKNHGDDNDDGAASPSADGSRTAALAVLFAVSLGSLAVALNFYLVRRASKRSCEEFLRIFSASDAGVDGDENSSAQPHLAGSIVRDSFPVHSDSGSGGSEDDLGRQGAGAPSLRPAPRATFLDAVPQTIKKRSDAALVQLNIPADHPPTDSPGGAGTQNASSSAVETGDDIAVGAADSSNDVEHLPLLPRGPRRRVIPLKSSREKQSAAGPPSTSIFHSLSSTHPGTSPDLEELHRANAAPSELTTSNLCYFVKTTSALPCGNVPQKTILEDVSISARSGDMVALMGCSGAGKTTLLDILAAREKCGKVTGLLRLNGQEIASAESIRLYRNIIGYVAYNDALLPHLTVKETIYYAARLKLPAAFSKRVVNEIVHELIKALHLDMCRNTIVGDEGSTRGLSSGERRRVSIAVELVANPRILFLDEPTTGLDASNARRVIALLAAIVKSSPLRRYAPSFFSFSPIIVASIHQPSQRVYEMFDKIVLLSQGRVIYQGECATAHRSLLASIPEDQRQDVLAACESGLGKGRGTRASDKAAVDTGKGNEMERGQDGASADQLGFEKKNSAVFDYEKRSANEKERSGVVGSELPPASLPLTRPSFSRMENCGGERGNPADFLLLIDEYITDDVRKHLSLTFDVSSAKALHCSAPLPLFAEEDATRAAERSENVSAGLSAAVGDPTLAGSLASASPPPPLPPPSPSSPPPPQHPNVDLLVLMSRCRQYYSDIYLQIAILVQRATSSLMGAYYLVTAHGLVTFIMGLLMCILYKQQPLDLPGTMNRAGSVTFLLLVQAFVSLSVLEQLVAERRLFVAERGNGFYSTLPYLMSKLVVDIIPLRVVTSVLVSSIIYFPIGLRTDDARYFLWFLFILALFTCCITFMVMCVGVLSRNFGSAALLSASAILGFFLFGGMLIQADSVPKFFTPFRRASPFYLAYESLLVNELNGQMCSFAPTDEAGRPSSTVIPLYCIQYLHNMSLHPENYAFDVALLILECFILIAIAYILLYNVTLPR